MTREMMADCDGLVTSDSAPSNCGLRRDTLFHHFKDKNDLGYAVVEEIVQPRIKTNWFDPLADSIDPITDVKQAMKRFAKEEQANRRLVQGCPLNKLAQEMSHPWSCPPRPRCD
jgi:AcrR family transcriptional regulator